MTEGTMVRRAELPLGDEVLPVTIVGERRGLAMLLLPSIFGTDVGTLELASQVAAWGCTVLVPDLFHRVDAGPTGFHELGKARAHARMRAFDRRRGLLELQSMVGYLRERGAVRVVAHGVCFGGHLALLLGLLEQVDAVCTVHGGGLQKLVEHGPSPVPLELHFGDNDAAIPPDHIQAVRDAFQGPGRNVYVHEGATHGFAHPGSPAFSAGPYAASLASLRSLLFSV